MNRLHFTFAAFAVAFAVLLPIAPAGATIYTTQISYLNALDALVTPYYTEGFQNLNSTVDTSNPTTLSFPNGLGTYGSSNPTYMHGATSSTFSYNLGSRPGDEGVAVVPGQGSSQAVATNLGGKPLVLNITSNNVYAVGGYFALTSISDGSTTTLSRTNQLDIWVNSSPYLPPSGDGQPTPDPTYSVSSGSNWAYYGIISSDPITSLTVLGWNGTADQFTSGTDNVAPAVDNLTVGDPASVPEPAFFQLGAMLALGGLGMLKIRRCK